MKGNMTNLEFIQKQTEKTKVAVGEVINKFKNDTKKKKMKDKLEAKDISTNADISKLQF